LRDNRLRRADECACKAEKREKSREHGGSPAAPRAPAKKADS
jgi:hypothetical protein